MVEACLQGQIKKTEQVDKWEEPRKSEGGSVMADQNRERFLYNKSSRLDNLNFIFVI